MMMMILFILFSPPLTHVIVSSTMLPLNGSSPSSLPLNPLTSSLSRLSLSQMDFPSALDQISILMSPTPSRIYKTSYYRKQTKDHWSRDDPAGKNIEGPKNRKG